MTNPKTRQGPSASNFYPTRPNEPIRRTINDFERQEASLLTHTAWIDNPPGKQNCHFLDLREDEVGPSGVTVNHNKEFDTNAKWAYLDGNLNDKVDDETAARIAYAHKKLPELFSKIKSDTKIIYPFKFDCTNGTFTYPDLETSFRKNLTQGNGKARATGFAVPIFGRLPKIFADTYLFNVNYN